MKLAIARVTVVVAGVLFRPSLEYSRRRASDH
jgi:hypothetical protein